MMIRHSHIQDLLDSMAGQIGKLLDEEANRNPELLVSGAEDLQRLVPEYFHINPWFTRVYISKSLKNLCEGLKSGLKPELMDRAYPGEKIIAFIVNPGAPFDGTGEIIYAVLCGYRCLIKLPAECKSLYESLFAYLALTCRDFSDSVEFFTDRLPSFDGVVGLNAFEGSEAVGYLNKWPNLLIYHKGCTVTMAGEESEIQLRKIAEGICDFYGRSFFSIKSLSVPPGYDFTPLFRILEEHNDNSNNHRYFNHYEYHKSLMLINGIHHFDNGFILLTSDQNQVGKTGVVTYSEYCPGSKSDEMNPEHVFNHNSRSDSDNQYFISGQPPPDETLFYNAGKLADFLSGL